MKLFFLILFVSAIFSMAGTAQNNPPVATSDTVSVMRQVQVLIDVKANDYDPDGDQIVIHNVVPHYGNAAIVDEKISYRSNPEYNTSDYFRYSVKDNGTPVLISNTTMVNIKLLPNPDLPVANADTFELMRLIPQTLSILANDYDPNGDSFKINSVRMPQNCTVQIDEDSLSVTVIPGHLPLCSFQYNMREFNTETAFISTYVTVSILSTYNPDVPVIMPDTAYATGGIPVLIPVLVNDYDPQGEEIEIHSVSYPGQGSAVISGDFIEFTPPLSFAGNVQFYYTINEKDDPAIYTEKASVTVYVAKNPDCPVGVDDFVSGTAALPMTIDVLANDYDPGNGALIIKDVSIGSITADNKILYQPNPLTQGQDSIFYRAQKANHAASYSEWTKVYIQLAVNPALPVAVNDYANAHAGIPIEIRPLLNDIKNAEDTIYLSNQTNSYKTDKGLVTISGDVMTYTSAFQAKGTDRITYFLRGKNNTILARGYVYVDITSQRFYDSLMINNINAGVNAHGALFYRAFDIKGQQAKGLISDAHFTVPAGGMANTIFASQLVIGGYNDSDMLHLSTPVYSSLALVFQAGPVSAIYDTNHYLRYGRTWKINKSDIDFHRQNYWKTGYEPIEVIQSWPGNGNPALGQAEKLAPFADVNNDGLYDCMQGDYPLIRGDQTIFIMYNDDVQRPGTAVQPMKVEIHAMIYGFDAPQDTALFNTVFVHYDLFNRSAQQYHDCYVGVLSDLDIGHNTDDFLASDVSRSSFYAYNGKAIDGNGQFFAYGENPPAQSVTVLGGPFMKPDGLDNPAGGCNESVNGTNFGNSIADDERLGLTTFFDYQLYDTIIHIGNPPNHFDFFNTMKGFWHDGTPFSYGGKGRPELGSTGSACRFMYPGNTDPLNWGTNCEFPEGGFNQGDKFWTEEQAGNLPTDKRGLGSMGPFDFAPGQVHEVDIAYCTGFGNSGPASSVNQLLSNIDSLFYKMQHQNLIVPNKALGLPETDKVALINLYPNPAGNFISIQGLPEGDAEYAIFNLMGHKVSEGRLLHNHASGLNITNLSKGMYLITLKSGNMVFNGKFIKQ